MDKSFKAYEKLEGFKPRIAPDATDGADILATIATQFEVIKAHYGDRNIAIDGRQSYYDGDMWESAKDEGEFQLVFNYCRRVVLDFAGMLARAPVPRVPFPPGDATNPAVRRARARERLLSLVWDDLLVAWQRAEMNAAKTGYGVIQLVWDPPEPASIPRGVASEGGTAPTEKRYLTSPFSFRNIDSHDFYPIYRTFDRSDDFLYVFRYDPGRLITDVNLKYTVQLQGTGSDETGAEDTCDLIEYWDGKYNILVAQTIHDLEASENASIRARLQTALERIRKGGQVTDFTVLHAEEHKYGRAPFWLIQNIVDPNIDPTNGGSLSDIEDIADLNFHLNMMRSEQAEEIVTRIHPPLVYQSADHSQDPSKIKYKAGAIIPIGPPSEEDIKDPLGASNREPIGTEHIHDIEAAIRTLSFLGEAGFGAMSAGTSGVAARIALTPLQRILELKLPPRLYCLRSLGSYVLQMFERNASTDTKLRAWARVGARRYDLLDISAADIEGMYYVDVEYSNLLPRDDDQHQQNEAFKFSSGLQSLRKTLENNGDDDPDAELAQIKLERQDPYLSPEKWLLIEKGKLEIETMKKALQTQTPEPTTAPGGAGTVPKPGQATPGQNMGGTVPNPATFPRTQGYGAGANAPFLQRQMQNLGQGRPAMGGPGIREGGEG